MLLDASAPEETTASPALRRDLAVMAAKARAASRPKRRRLGIAATAVLAALLASGAGTAVAATVFNWEPWAQDPDIAYPFTLPSGRTCEARVAVYEIKSIDGNGAVTRTDPANDSDFARHLRVLNLVNQADVQASIAEVRQRDTSVSYVAVTPAGSLEDVPATASGPTADDVYAAAVSAAVRDAINKEAAAFDGGHDYTANESILCEQAAS
ncbi:hypothetical protein ABC270_07840 [Curtobacterium sp. 1P10AnD]|uniref:hypothetical protein n=1 Tax=Curtobacterium sp. 1P10AnD TaxID=3132283 RepID=UPI0039A3998E